jgi:hypothetical protein
VKGRKITGKVHLQFDIGPQARAPLEWERTHVLAFTVMVNEETRKVEFSVEVPQGTRKLRLTFSGYYFADGIFAGIYSVDGKERGAFFTRAIPKPANQQVWDI